MAAIAAARRLLSPTIAGNAAFQHAWKAGDPAAWPCRKHTSRAASSAGGRAQAASMATAASRARRIVTSFRPHIMGGA